MAITVGVKTASAREVETMKKNRAGGRELGLLTIVGTVLIVLKLTHVIDWSWWLVLAPLYIPYLYILLIFIGLVIFLVRKRKNGQS